MANALDSVLDELAARLAKAIGGGGAAGEFCDQATAPVPRLLYMRAARERAFPTFRIGKRILARRADLVAWVEAHRVGAVAPAVPEVDEVQRTLEEWGQRARRRKAS